MQHEASCSQMEHLSLHQVCKHSLKCTLLPDCSIHSGTGVEENSFEFLMACDEAVEAWGDTDQAMHSLFFTHFFR